MNRKVILTKDAILWESGETARNIAVLEKGRLGVRAGKELVGIVLPKMIFGETALLGLKGDPPLRTATVFAMEDDTVVTEYPPALVHKMFEVEDRKVAVMVLKTLVGQVGKHCLMVYNANRDYKMIREAMIGCLRGLIAPSRDLEQISCWDSFMRTFVFLSGLRDYLSTLTRQYVTASTERAEMVQRSSEMVREMMTDEDVDLAGVMTDFIQEEKARDEWFEH